MPELGHSYREILAAMTAIATRINERPLDVDGTLRAIADAARTLTGSNGSRIWLVDGDALVGAPGATSGSLASLNDGLSLPLALDVPPARCFRERTTVVVRRCARKPGGRSA